MARSRLKTSGRRESGRFTGIPHAVMHHSDYIALSYTAKSLLFELALQYNGYNNGDLTAAWSILSKRGWNSKSTLVKALRELIERGFVIRSRTGWFSNPGSRCALYAITWNAVDDCYSKNLEISSTITPIRSFKVK